MSRACARATDHVVMPQAQVKAIRHETEPKPLGPLTDRSLLPCMREQALEI